MMSRSWISMGLAACVAMSAAGCTKDNKEEAPKPEPAPSASAPSRSRLNLRGPLSPMAKMDPQVMKDYRLDICYYGTLALREARAKYLASLGKDEPSAKKIPSFGGVDVSAPKPPHTTPEAQKDAKPGAAPSASASAAPPKPARPFLMRPPYEGYARACTAAVQLKEPAMGEVDTAVAAYAPFAVELAKDITAASNYYQQEEYKKDDFAKGKELHKKLVSEFDKLDALQDKVGESLAAWRKAHPVDEAKMDEGEKIARGAFEDARSALEDALAKKPDPAAYKASVDKFEKSVEALKTFSTSHANDPWSKLMVGPFDTFLKNAKEAKISDKGLDADSFLGLVTSFRGLIEARQRAVSRALIQKGQTSSPTLRQIEPHPAPAAPHPEQK